MNHKDKLHLARKMSVGKKKKDLKNFQTLAWQKRREGIAEGVKNRIEKAHKKALERKLNDNN